MIRAAATAVVRGKSLDSRGASVSRRKCPLGRTLRCAASLEQIASNVARLGLRNRRQTDLRLRAEKTGDPLPDFGSLLFFAVFLVDAGLPQKHLQPVLHIAGHCLVTGCNHIVVSIL